MPIQAVIDSAWWKLCKHDIGEPDVHAWDIYQIVDEWFANLSERDTWVSNFQKGTNEIHWLKSLGWLAAVYLAPPSDDYLLHIQDTKRKALSHAGGHLADYAYIGLTSRAGH